MMRPCAAGTGRQRMLGDGAGDAPDPVTLFDALPSPYVVLDPALRIVQANRAYLRSVGRSFADIAGCHLFEVFPPASDTLDAEGRVPAQAVLERVARTGAAESLPLFRYDLIDPVTGQMSERHWLLSAAPVPDEDGSTAFVVQRTEDVTDFVLEHRRGRLALEQGDLWRRRVEQVEADLFLQAQELEGRARGQGGGGGPRGRPGPGRTRAQRRPDRGGRGTGRVLPRPDRARGRRGGRPRP